MRCAGAIRRPGEPLTTLQIPGPAAPVERQVAAALQFCEELRLPDPPEPALGAVQNGERPELALSVWLLAGGVAKLGLLAPEQSKLLQLHRH